MIEAMRTSMILLWGLLACGGDDNKKVDASTANDTLLTDTGTSDTPGGGFDCATYCTTIMSACTAARAQYASMQNCVDSCANFPVGTNTDQTGNTLGCRYNHAQLAVGDPGTHCVHAGPSGVGACGTACAGFCSIVLAECPTQWPTMQACNSNQTGCPSFSSQPPFAAPSAGDTLECRLYHATMAATDPTGHCGHTTANSTVCQ